MWLKLVKNDHFSYKIFGIPAWSWYQLFSIISLRNGLKNIILFEFVDFDLLGYIKPHFTKGDFFLLERPRRDAKILKFFKTFFFVSAMIDYTHINQTP